ncbi:transposon Ty3-G Gag-Pol polyprotein [Caerostris extrusa]|uniref:Transposon Ty3-G Gag-Pol polyprotein n=1 Tax=Caerostris extrusa TaxID=172846 RepID=A0AAV4S646_CAEEX|nr:transposon Ty3-G Gag-Pol polyprotein [Caerostris extrusa]
MTVSRTTPLLFSFRTKIEEAINLVPRMPPESKLKAVQFWNIVSEKLQDIVNNSAADISAIALNMEETNACSDKLSMEMNSSTNYIVPTSTSDFMNISQNYAMFSESGTQFQSADLYNTDLKQLPPSSSVPSNIEELPPNNEITHIPHAHNLNAMNNTLQSESEINQQLLDIANISSNSENFTQNIHSSEISNANIRTSNSIFFKKIFCKISKKVMLILDSLLKIKEQNCNSFNCNTKICDNSSNPTTQRNIEEAVLD